MASAAPNTTTPQPEMNKIARAKLAKDTINTLIPQILKTNERARAGVSASELIRYNPSLFPKQPTLPPTPTPDAAQEIQQAPTTPQTTPPRIKVIKSDTFDAAHSLLTANPGPRTRIAVLNMASPLRPGGGVLNGARAQEESLCMRGTLYASLHDSYYRIPENAAVYSPDVLVFRASDHMTGGGELAKKEWWWVDVISCAALRMPEVVVKVMDWKDGEVVKEKAYENDGQREAMTMKVRLILQIAMQKGITHLVLGALGCGAYGNPPVEVARIFKKVLCGDRKKKGITVEESGIEEIVFAIFDEGENLRVFGEAFGNAGEGGGG
jgi:uncharacterized protein (TIGR02452 family)